jgi:hypothetical protein
MNGISFSIPLMAVILVALYGKENTAATAFS